jgi:methylenetetrahydrofolate reductase (NADPH)
MTSATKLAVAELLRGCSVEVTPGDSQSIRLAGQMLAPATEVFIAYLPRSTPEQLVVCATELRRHGLTPVPHIVARAVSSAADLDRMLGRLVDEAGVERALVIAGDRDVAAGPFASSVEVLQSGAVQRSGIGKVFVSCYPEGHPRIDADALETARLAKIRAIQDAGLAGCFVSQFCFEERPILDLAHHMREQGSPLPYRIGLAGPASTATLVKYAMACGVGASVRALRERQGLARTMFGGFSPAALIEEIANARAAGDGIGIDGVHFFTFGALAKTADLVNALTKDHA